MVIERSAYPNSGFMVLVSGDIPTLEERLLMAKRIFEIHKSRLTFVPKPIKLMPPAPEANTGFSALENAKVGSYADAINSAMNTSQETKLIIKVLAGETPLQAAKRISRERKNDCD